MIPFSIILVYPNQESDVLYLSFIHYINNEIECASPDGYSGCCGTSLGIGHGCYKVIDGLVIHNDGTSETLQEWMDYHYNKKLTDNTFNFNWMLSTEKGLYC